ncbi:MAG: hypothetical protein Q4D19_05295 [Lautropia sp.]|nr:hypothetical protein [Lautropia sp.]
MKTMTFNGRTMREAIAQAKARFGADVDILDSGAVGDEVQVTVVVPVPRSVARRRRAIAEMSSNINAAAKSKEAAGKTSVDEAVTQEPVPAVDVAADAQSAPDTMQAATIGAQKAVASESAADAAEQAGTRAKGRTSRATRTEKAPAEGRLARTVAAVAGRKGRKKQAASDEAAMPVTQADDAGGSVGTASPANGKKAVDADARALSDEAVSAQVPGSPGDLGTAWSASMPVQQGMPLNGATAGVAMQPSVSADNGPVSTLDFERLRRQRAQETGAGVVKGESGAAPVTPTVAFMSEQHGFVHGVAGATAAPLAAGTSAAMQNAATVPGQLSSFAALMQERQQAAALQMPVGVPGAEPARVQSTAEVAQLQAQLQAQAQAAAVTAHVQQAPKSRLWQMVDSAKRLFGRKRIWTAPDAEAQMQTLMAGSASQQAMSLASTLDGTNGGWPVLQMPGGFSAASPVPEGFLKPGDQALQGIGWFEATRRRPGQMRLLRNLLRCQFSPGLARTLVDLLPADYGDVQADEWLRQTLLRTLVGVNAAAGMRTVGEKGFFDKGGVFALIGPTGVGKTTSIAKIAAHHVLRHGPGQLALITADVYRIGAQEQLRAFGRMLGVPVQVAQDKDVLQSLLKEHENRSLVLIDTAGISQRDERVAQLTSALALSQVKRVLVMNAAAQPGSVEEMLEAFGARDTAGVLLSKVDEAVGLGSCMDALLRHRLPLVGYADGQRVPEDYHPANFVKLVEQALDADTANRYRSLSMTDSEMRQLFEASHV